MTGRRVARILPRMLNLVVLVVSGGYLLVYLYRWEWNRAVISGIFFIAAEIALATSLILGAVRRRPAAEGTAVGARAITLANKDRHREPFAWLVRNDRLGVFVPVLLGAGVLLSGLAYVVERVAGALAGSRADRKTAALVNLDLPLGSGAAGGPLPAMPGSPRHTRAQALAWTVGAAAMLLAMVAGIDVLADATQSRLAARESKAGTTTVVVEIDEYDSDLPDTDLAEALWIVCRYVAPPDANLQRATPVGHDRVQLVIEPALGDLRRRRVFGCFEDATIDRVRVDIVGWSLSRGEDES